MDLLKSASATHKTLVFPEGDDPRTCAAVARLVGEGIARCLVLGRPDAVARACAAAGVDLSGDVERIDPETDARLDALAGVLFERRKAKGLTAEEARSLAADPLYFGGLLVSTGAVDGSVAGAAHASGDVIRAAIHTIGVAKGSPLVSSFFLMVMPDGRPLTFADCGVIARPTPEELAGIGVDAARNHRFLMGEEPRVAFLSFSTRGSAEHEEVTRVREAVTIAQRRAPELAIDGELQFDAAFVPDVGVRKAPGSVVAGRANVFVFPDLDAGNIGYKIAQRLGGAAAYGPILQGLARPANDLSRGATADDIVSVAAITALQAAALDAGDD